MRRVLYGLNIAPHRWCEGRDKTMAETKAELLGLTITYILWYIDDALLAIKPSFLEPLTVLVGSMWTTTQPEYLDEVGVLAYKGFEIERKGEALVLH